MAHIIHIVGYDNQKVIGIKDQLPFTLPEDLAQFKLITDNSLICMGFNTYQSILKNHMKGKTDFLPNRKIMVACSDNAKAKARNLTNTYDNVTFLAVEPLRHLVSRNQEPVIVVGGAKLYERFHPTAVLATEVDCDVPAGTPEEDLVKYDIALGKDSGFKRLVLAEEVSANGLKYKRVLYLS